MASFQKKFMKDPIKLKEGQQLLFLKRLSRLLGNGYSFIDALEAIKWDKHLLKTADVIIFSMKNGLQVDEAFKASGFHASIVSYLYFVRINGDIMTSMDKCIEMFEQRMKSLSKFKQVIRYPLVLLSFLILLLFFLKWSVLPAFAEMFGSSDASAKSIMISVNLMNFAGTMCILTLFLGIITGILWKVVRKDISIEKRIQLYDKLPFFRHYMRLQTSYYFATHMSMFLKSGMSLKNVIIHMANQKELPMLSHYAELMEIQLQKGFYVDHLLEQMVFIESHISSIFEKNNNIADLQKDLTAYADFLTEAMERKVMRMITFIQPFFFSVLAAMIIFIYLTLMWPMFQLINTI